MMLAEEDIFAQLAKVEGVPVRVILFTSITDNAEYKAQRERVKQHLSEKFGAQRPMSALIVQPPLGATLYAEVTTIEQAGKIAYHDDYILLDGEVVISGGIHAPHDGSIGDQSEEIFQRVRAILSAEGLAANDIVRQWNFIEHITSCSEQGQNYQQFNDARSRFYSGAEWSNGYPAATGIGAEGGGVVILFVAVRHSSNISRAVDNPLQISAHAYSQQVLIEGRDQHKTTPKFERARWVGSTPKDMIYISGTAAIRGEESLQADAAEQIAMTMDNIAHLVSTENQSRHNVPQPKARQYEILRVYVKREESWREIANWINNNCPCHNVAFLKADICRAELLVEVEGIAK